MLRNLCSIICIFFYGSLFAQMAVHSDVYLGSEYELYNAFDLTSFHSGIIYIDRNGGVWTNASSILFKTNFIDLDNEWIHNQINSISVKKWDYKNTNETHIGPTSEEFIVTFGVGNGADTSHLGAIDVSGVALKGVQALIEKVETLKEKVEGLKIENSNYQNKLQKQELLLQQLMTRLEALENQ
jgi:hypothetical protein